jgi:hexosaminidase
MSRVRRRATLLFANLIVVLALVVPGCASRKELRQQGKFSALLERRCAGPTEPLRLIPLPRRIRRSQGWFSIPSSVTISADSPAGQRVAALLAADFQSLGFRAAVSANESPQSTIRFMTERRPTAYGEEGYRLLVRRRDIVIVASSGAGMFYGAQTLEQLASEDGRQPCSIPKVDITDWPEYRWRGIQLDASRHFFPTAVVEQYIDVAARFKLNMFHWHLSDDQGWRIDIRAFPNLARIGGCRDGTQIGGFLSGQSDGVRTCQYYTQGEIRELVAYAAERYVSVVPEIEGPGHSVEVLAAYPFLACAPGPFATLTLWGSTKYALCPTERTFSFYDDVMREIAGLFPTPLVHIGGDEVPSFSWRTSSYVAKLMRRENLPTMAAVQGYYTRRMEAIAHKYGRQIVGWDEIVSGGVSSKATVMAWNGSAAAADAAKRGNKVVMTPQSPLYFDAVQGQPQFEPPAIGGVSASPTTLEMVYAYDPRPPTLTRSEQAKIIGAQANVWTEYIPDASHLWYMAYPRALALAELCWTPRRQMRWGEFTRRLGPALARLETRGVTFRIPEIRYEVRTPGTELAFSRAAIVRATLPPHASHVTVALQTVVPGATIHYTVDGSEPTSSSPTYKRALRFAMNANPLSIVAVAVLNDNRSSPPSFLTLTRR